MVFISPDVVWSDSIFKRLDQLLIAGSDAWVKPRALVRIPIEYLHPTMDECFFERGRGVKLLPCTLMWKVTSGDLLFRSFHIHPLLVHPRNCFAKSYQTIDGDLVHFACPDPEDHYVVTDSDEMTCVEFSKRKQFIGGIVEKEDVAAVAKWAVDNANKVHWTLFGFVARLHSGPVADEDWRTVEERAHSVSQRIFRVRSSRRVHIWIAGSAIAVIQKITSLPPW